MYKFQIAEVHDAERPEYEYEDNIAWITEIETDNADDLLCFISDWLNDENYPTNQWTRIVKDNVVLQSGIQIK